MAVDPIEEARDYLQSADRLRHMPLSPFGRLEELEQRDREVLQLHIRAMVAAAAVIDRAAERLTRREDEPQ